MEYEQMCVALGENTEFEVLKPKRFLLFPNHLPSTDCEVSAPQPLLVPLSNSDTKAHLTPRLDMRKDSGVTFAIVCP